MIEKEKIILKNLDKRVGTLYDKFDRLKKGVDGRTLLITGKMDSVAKKIDERMDRFEESNRKNGILLEKLDTKFDLALEGYSSLKELTEKLNDRVTVLERQV